VVAGTSLKVGGEVNFSVISPAMKALVTYYKEKGVGFSISPDIIEDPKDIAFVQFIIDEKPPREMSAGWFSAGPRSSAAQRRRPAARRPAVRVARVDPCSSWRGAGRSAGRSGRNSGCNIQED